MTFPLLPFHIQLGTNPLVIRLPRVAVSPEYADYILEEVTADHDVFLDGRGQVLTNESFPYRVAAALKEKSPRSVTLVGGSREWVERFESAARDYGLPVKVEALNIT